MKNEDRRTTAVEQDALEQEALHPFTRDDELLAEADLQRRANTVTTILAQILHQPGLRALDEEQPAPSRWSCAREWP
jgi:hypothetical protein